MMLLAIALSASGVRLGGDDSLAKEAACEIGRFLLARRPDSGTPVGETAIYDDRYAVPIDGGPSSNIFVACPALRDSLPANRKLATDDDRRRASGITQPDPLTIYAISAPMITGVSDAVVATTYSCPGLCYGLFEIRFKLINRRWTQVAGPQLKVVS